jgi:hypothetical protein
MRFRELYSKAHEFSQASSHKDKESVEGRLRHRQEKQVYHFLTGPLER